MVSVFPTGHHDIAYPKRANGPDPVMSKLLQVPGIATPETQQRSIDYYQPPTNKDAAGSQHNAPGDGTEPVGGGGSGLQEGGNKPESQVVPDPVCSLRGISHRVPKAKDDN